jgi:hypothetical protein
MNRLRSFRPRAFGNRRLWILFGLPVAALAALSTLFTVSLLPPSVHKTQVAYALASSELYMNAPTGAGAAPALTYFYGLQQWSEVLAEEMTSPLLKQLIARADGIPTNQLAIDGPIAYDLQRTQQEPTGEKRSNQLLTEADPYRIELDTNIDFGAIGISARAPSAAAAFKLVRASELALHRYLIRSQRAAGLSPKLRLVVAELAPIVLAGGSGGHTMSALVFIIVFILWTGLVVVVSKLRRELLAIRDAQERGVAQIPMPPGRSSVGGRF